MPRRKTKRPSELLHKGNSGTLTASEDADLNALVEELKSLTLANAEAMARSRGFANTGVRTAHSGRRRPPAKQ